MNDLKNDLIKDKMKIAIIGSGISGLSSALILGQKHQVTLFESDSRLGGHAHTYFADNNNNNKTPIDTGFLVFNELTYPHFCAMLDYLNVETCESNMTLSIKTQNNIEWAGTNLQTVFAQKKNIFSKEFLLMIRDILKFHKQAYENIELAKTNQWTLSDMIKYRNFSNSFVEWYLVPMTGAIWSMPYKDVLEFPAFTFMQFCINHKLLQVEDRPIWRTIKNGSVNYVNQISKQLNDIRLNQKINEISKNNDKLIIHSINGVEEFDKIIIATSAPVAFNLLEKNFPKTAEVLKKARTSANKVTLHTDSDSMPKNKKTWSAWNVKSKKIGDNSSAVELTYYINKLQPIDSKENYFVTLNSENGFKNEIFNTTYHHPQFSFDMISIQNNLSTIQGRDGIYFAGAWTRYGFHEDGILSAVNVAKALGVQPPWKI